MSGNNPKRPRLAMKGATIYKNDVVIHYHPWSKSAVGGSGNKKEVDEFTWRSRRRLAFVASNTSIRFQFLTTLTYPRDYPADGKLVKSHLNKYLNHVRRKDGGSYLWWLEFQKRGAPHFHVLTERGYGTKEDVSALWYKIVGSNDGRHLGAGTRFERLRKPNGAARYAVKYAMKMYQKKVPPEYRNVGRFWGHSRAVKPVAVSKVIELWNVNQLAELLDDEELAEYVDAIQFSIIYNASRLDD